jgi:hypothetical protein
VDYYNLKSIIASQKTPFPMRMVSESFCLAPKREQPYIEPTFSKVVYDLERPAIILISAVGATGKTALAQVLSNETGLPLLDLGKHKPVGDNTLTGLLTNAFRVEDLSKIFEGLGKGTFGVIIDGIDEGRSKTTEKAFEAFLDDIVRLCPDSKNTTFVLLGRTQILEECWLYLTGKGATTGLVSISPFDLDRARKYIDVFTEGMKSTQVDQYIEVRENILSRLGSAFGASSASADENFLSFIGYPPVLDAIVTLLTEEKNYHRVLGDLEETALNDVETNLLWRIGHYILRREKEEKVLPNIVRPLVSGMPAQDAIVGRVFEPEEQSLRLISYCLGRQITLNQIEEPLINEKYEAQLVSWLHEHPFINGRQFRNAVFESMILAILIASGNPLSEELVLEYTSTHKFNYHLVYLLDIVAPSKNVPLPFLHILLGSALEFRSTTTSIEMRVDGVEPDRSQFTSGQSSIVETEIEIIMSKEKGKSKSFTFQSVLGDTPSVRLGNRLSTISVSLPREVILSGQQELELTAPVEIYAAKIVLSSPAMVLKHPTPATDDDHVLLEAQSLESTVANILTNGVDLALAISDRSGLTYPSVLYVQQRTQLPTDPLLKDKYLRLKRILMSFRSHSRGSMARYKHKIENDRVLSNDTGWAVLRRLQQDGIVTLSGNFYFLNPESVDAHLGVSWSDLRKGTISEKLLRYLQAIN